MTNEHTPLSNDHGDSSLDIDKMFFELTDELEESRTPFTVQEQTEFLWALQKEHRKAQQATGMLEAVVNRLPAEAIGSKDTEVSLRTSLPKPGVEEVYFRINYRGKDEDGKPTIKNIFIPIAQRLQGNLITPQERSGYDDHQAALAFAQIDELMSLKEDDILPNLSPDGAKIDNPTTALILDKAVKIERPE